MGKKLADERDAEVTPRFGYNFDKSNQHDRACVYEELTPSTCDRRYVAFCEDAKRADEDARRINAALNQCRGISTDDLECQIITDLLGEAKSVVAAIDSLMVESLDTLDLEECRDRLRRILSKVRGEETPTNG